MCTLALYFHLLDDPPMLVAANRDEHYDRPSAAPTLWRQKPAIIAGRDLVAGGTWLGVNEHGLLVGILNRRLSNETGWPAATRSRGLLCLDLLGLKSAAAARAFALAHEAAYQPFTVLFADPREAWSAYNVRREIKLNRLNPGLHVFSSTAEFAAPSEKMDRAHRHFARLTDALRSKPGDRSYGLSLLAEALGDHTFGDGSSDPRDAICVHGDVSGTVSSSIIFYSAKEQRFYSYFSPGPPCRTPFGRALTLESL